MAAQGWDGVEWRVVDQQTPRTAGFWAGNRCTWPLTGLEQDLPGSRGSPAGPACGSRGSAATPAATSTPTSTGCLPPPRPSAQATSGCPRPRSVRRPTPTSSPTPATWCGPPGGPRARRHGLVELHHQTIVSTSSAALRLVDGVDPAAVGVIHDLGNLVIEGHEDVRAALQMLGPYLAHVHVKNGVWRRGDTEADGLSAGSTTGPRCRRPGRRRRVPAALAEPATTAGSPWRTSPPPGRWRNAPAKPRLPAGGPGGRGGGLT